MTISSISKSLVSAITGISAGSSSSVNSLSSQKSDDAAVNSVKLRTAAQTLNEAFSRLNVTGSYLNISRDALIDLSELVDRAILLADKAGKASTSSGDRAKADLEFQKIGRQFEKIVSSLESDDFDLLTVEGITKVFEVVGLNKKQSESLARVFNSFIVPPGDDSLASEETKGKAAVLPAVSQGTAPAEAFTKKQISSNQGGTAPSSVHASAVGTAYLDDDDPVSQSDGSDTAIFISDTGHAQSVLGVTDDLKLLSTSEVSGYSLISSAQDFLGSNPDGVTQLYLTDSNGKVIHQYTQFSTNVLIESADLSSDGLTVTLVSNGNLAGINGDGSEEVFLIELDATDLGQAGSGIISQVTSFNAGANIVNDVKINESGTLLAYTATGLQSDGSGLFRGLGMYDIQSDTHDSVQSLRIRLIGFSADDQILTYSTLDSSISTYALGDGNTTLVHSPGLTSQLFTVSENGYLAYKNTANDIVMTDISNGLTATTTTVYDSQAGDTITALSVSKNSQGKLKVALAGILSASDPNSQVYVFEENSPVTAAPLSKPVSLPEVFDYSIKSRANALQVEEDLKALKAQITQNIKALDQGMETLQNNLELVGALGNSFLSLSADSTLIGNIDSIVLNLSRSLRTYGVSQAALNQLDNIEPIVISTLLTEA